MATDRSPQLMLIGDASPLFRRLQKGQLLQARIVHVLGNENYLLRIQGYNLVMKSKRKFQQFDEIEVIIKAKSPYLVLEVLTGKNSAARSPLFGNGYTDILA